MASACETGTLSAAARQLGITANPPSASRGVSLFVNRFLEELAPIPGFYLAPDLRQAKVSTATTT